MMQAHIVLCDFVAKRFSGYPYPTVKKGYDQRMVFSDNPFCNSEELWREHMISCLTSPSYLREVTEIVSATGKITPQSKRFLRWQDALVRQTNLSGSIILPEKEEDGDTSIGRDQLEKETTEYIESMYREAFSQAGGKMTLKGFNFEILIDGYKPSSGYWAISCPGPRKGAFCAPNDFFRSGPELCDSDVQILQGWKWEWVSK